MQIRILKSVLLSNRFRCGSGRPKIIWIRIWNNCKKSERSQKTIETSEKYLRDNNFIVSESCEFRRFKMNWLLVKGNPHLDKQKA
jgi:hypothetical protein